MSDIELVIKIPEEEYRRIKEYYEKKDIVESLYSYIYYGIPLPKGHGRLIDIDAVWNEYPNKPFIDCITETPTIIEGSES